MKNYSYKNYHQFLSNIDEILVDIEFIKKKDGFIANVPAVFDIETSSFYDGYEKNCCMYAWVFGINGKCIRGRTWVEFIDIMDYISTYYDLINKKRTFVIYVHNLGYEFQFFNKYFNWAKVFSLDERKPIYALSSLGIEFRCSYLLSGYSLEKVGENLTKYKVNKAVGDLDYKLIRHSSTPLTETEWNYILCDGLVVMSYIQEEIERLGDITKIPMTKTGYVRNYCRENCLKGTERWSYSKLMSKCTLKTETYTMMKHAFMGGFTHANKKHVGKTISNVHSYDFTSAYPSVMLSEKFPMGSPKKVKIKNETDFKDYINGYCCMFEVTFNELMPKVDFENYIPLSKCSHIEHYYCNNGRVVEAETLTITLTEQDFFIIYDLYEWESMIVKDFYIFYPAYLPKPFISSILKLYKDKTELKGVSDKIVEYMVSKGMLNACYGMCVTDPCRDEILFEESWKTQPSNIEEAIEVYNKSRTRFLYYAWGIWVTAYSRRNLFSAIMEFGNDYIYSDTDSVKVVNINKHKNYFEQYNKNIKSKIQKCLKHYELDEKLAEPLNIKGVAKPLGVWEYEGKYDKFKTLGAKRYIVEQDNEIEITIAGVSKKSGKRYLEYAFGSPKNVFDNFKDGLHFPAYYDHDGVEENGSGKLCHTYIDKSMSGTVIDYMGNEAQFHEESGVFLENTDFTLSMEADFLRLVNGLDLKFKR